MALPGTIIITRSSTAATAVLNAFTAIGGTLILDKVDDRNCIRDFQPETIASSLTPGRSRWGTAQQPGVPTTNTAKFLWVFSGVPVTRLQAVALQELARDNTTYSCSLTDNLWETLIAGSEVTKTVRIILNNGKLFDGDIALDRSTGGNVFSASFSALEL
jgi:hypothetical protein